MDKSPPPSETEALKETAALKVWAESLRLRDPELFATLSGERALAPADRVNPEGLQAAPANRRIQLETLVAQGRPAFLIQKGAIVGDQLPDAASALMKQRLDAAENRLRPIFPLVGRINVTNLPGRGSTYIGTGWLVDQGIVVTNRHVAEQVARDAANFEFSPGQLGRPLGVAIDYLQELDNAEADVATIRRVIWIERDQRRSDIAFLEVEPGRDGSSPGYISLAEKDARPGDAVAVIGYPARASADIIPDQDWMRRVYGEAYDVKRIAPGLAGAFERRSTTHDCTTLGGNSGSVLVSLTTGEAVGLHFAGEFKVANYAVPASDIRRYLHERPWQGPPKTAEPQPASQPVVFQAPVETATVQGTTITIPLTITIELGAGLTVSIANGGARAATMPIEAALTAFRAAHPDGEIAETREGYRIIDGALTDERCLCVLAMPDACERLAGTLPKAFGGWPVVVRPSPLRIQLAADRGWSREGVFDIQYDDEVRTGEAFSLASITEPMTLTCHVGPERSWEQLAQFLKSTRSELVSAIYEFHASHISDAIEERLDDGVDLTLVMARQTLSGDDRLLEGDFPRESTFNDWDNRFAGRFRRITVPTGRAGMVENAYHIKVSVQDRRRFWLSSGNWKRQSQPRIPPSLRDDPRATGAMGNREWHVVIDNEKLAKSFREHILADFARCKVLLGLPESTGTDEPEVDVPELDRESFELEKMPARVFEPLTLDRSVTVRPLLTPDGRGAVYCGAAIELIRSAKQSLLIQNQYIAVDPSSSGLFGDLIEAVVEASRRVRDCRIILRSEGADFLADLQELKRRGLDVMRCVRRLPATHTKGVIADGERILIGSHNWSASGVTRNRDASLVFDDAEIATYFGQVFEVDWERAPALRLSEPKPIDQPRIATGSEPEPGFRRVKASVALPP